MIDTDKQSPRSADHSAPAIRAYLGGSFDPVHRGHLQMALGVYRSLMPLAQANGQSLEVCLLPNARSPFKEHSSAPEHRLAMLQLACADTPLNICTLELWQKPPVYSIDSVRHLRQQYPNDSLIFIMGADSVATLERWKEGLALTDYVHLWVFKRSLTMTDTKAEASINPEADIAQLVPMTLQQQITHSVKELLQPIEQAECTDNLTKSQGKGAIYIDDSQILSISSTQLRQAVCQYDLAANDTATLIAEALPRQVLDYIRQHHLYCDAEFVKITD